MRRKILVIDDEKDLLEVLREQLEDLGIDVVTEGDPEKAVLLVKSREFDAVMSDLKMPKLSGLQILEEIRSEFPDLPFVILSGHANEVAALQALRLRALDLMHKPFKVDELSRVLARAVDIGAKQREIDTKLDQLAATSEDAKKITDAIKSKRRQISLLQINKNKPEL